MHPFLTGRDFYDTAASQQLALGVALLVFLFVGVLIAIHMVRRGFRAPVATEGTKLPPELRLRKYEIGARLYHWGNAVFLALLAVSGIALFRPTTLPAGPWLLIHEISAGLFIASLILHIFVAPQRGSGRTMWFERRDWRDLKLTVRNFFGATTEYPAFGKYDPWQKLYHAYLTVASAAVIFSGTFLIVNAEVWATYSHEWMRSMRLLHDVGATGFTAAVVGHIYFGIIRVNWPQLISMLTGHLRGVSFNRYHDAARWVPPANNATEVVRKPATRESTPLERAAD